MLFTIEAERVKYIFHERIPSVSLYRYLLMAYFVCDDKRRLEPHVGVYVAIRRLAHLICESTP